jgi:hypothetical protein
MSQQFFARMKAIFGEPKTDDPVGYVGELSKLIAKYSAEQLDGAVDHLAATHKFRTWPLPAEILVACERSAAALHRPTSAPARGLPPEWSPEAVTKADQLVAGDLGRQAAQEGWILALHDHCRRYGRLPDDRGVFRCKSQAKGVDEELARLTDASSISTGLRRLGQAIVERRNALAQRVRVKSNIDQ